MPCAAAGDRRGPRRACDGSRVRGRRVSRRIRRGHDVPDRSGSHRPRGCGGRARAEGRWRRGASGSRCAAAAASPTASAKSSPTRCASATSGSMSFGPGVDVGKRFVASAGIFSSGRPLLLVPPGHVASSHPVAHRPGLGRLACGGSRGPWRAPAHQAGGSGHRRECHGRQGVPAGPVGRRTGASAGAPWRERGLPPRPAGPRRCRARHPGRRAGRPGRHDGDGRRPPRAAAQSGVRQRDDGPARPGPDAAHAARPHRLIGRTIRPLDRPGVSSPSNGGIATSWGQAPCNAVRSRQRSA